MNSHRRSFHLTWLVLICAVLVQGCATSAFKTAGMRNLMQNSQFQLALQDAESQLQKNPDGVMENMNVGTLRYINKDYSGSNEAFEIAKLRIDDLYATSITEQAGAAVINDETISFQGDRFEQVLVHLYKAKNYLNLGQPDSARVELLQSQVKMNEWGEPADETPFMRYFSGMLFEMLGEQDSATVSYRKAVNAYRITRDKHGLDVPRQLQYDLLRMLSYMRIWDEFKQYQKEFGLTKYRPPSQKGKGELIVIVGNGMVPQRQQKVFQTWAPTLALNVRIAVPDYPNPPQRLNYIRLKIDDKYFPIRTVSNLDGMARAALQENMPTITTRAIARAVLKKKSEKEVGDKHGFLGQLTMMVINQGTEIADTRCWNTLPQEIQMARINLPAGDYSVSLEFLSPGGVVVDRLSHRVSIGADQKTFLTEHWISPLPKTPQSQTAQVQPKLNH